MVISLESIGQQLGKNYYTEITDIDFKNPHTIVGGPGWYLFRRDASIHNEATTITLKQSASADRSTIQHIVLDVTHVIQLDALGNNGMTTITTKRMGKLHSSVALKPGEEVQLPFGSANPPITVRRPLQKPARQP